LLAEVDSDIGVLTEILWARFFLQTLNWWTPSHAEQNLFEALMHIGLTRDFSMR